MLNEILNLVVLLTDFLLQDLLLSPTSSGGRRIIRHTLLLLLNFRNDRLPPFYALLGVEIGLVHRLPKPALTLLLILLRGLGLLLHNHFLVQHFVGRLLEEVEPVVGPQEVLGVDRHVSSGFGLLLV